MVDRDWQGELSEALGLARAEQRNSAAEIEHRLGRVEALLAADLDKLGEAVLGATASRLDARLAALVDRIDGLLAPAEGVASADAAPAGDAAEGLLNFAGLGARSGAVPLAQLEHLNRRLDEVVERLDQLARSLAR